jgi:type I restriction enzyme M protein
LKDADKLLKAYQEYQKQVDVAVIDKANKTQRKLAETIVPFFTSLHELLKEVDKKVRHIEKDLKMNKDLKILKVELENLHKEAKATEYFFGHIAWLHERFPEAKYEDVTGLCKLANLDEVKEQEYSLNPGRYVGVVIEEDGKTEEEFIEEMLALNDELNKLNKEAKKLEDVINHNIRQIAGD